MFSRRIKDVRGFTLIELLVIMVIIALLSVVAIVTLSSSQRKSRDARRLADLKELQKAVELYHSELGVFPLTTSTSNETWTEFGTAIENYITNTPIDPTNRDDTDYVYSYGTNNAGSEYFLGAKLENTAHAALKGDDDIAYAATTIGWTNLDLVESNDITGNDPLTTFDCGDTIPDATSGHYCISE